MKKAIVAYEAVLTAVAKEACPAEWAMTQHNLGDACRELPTGDIDGNLRQAIAAYEAAFAVYTKQAYPAEWASTQHNLGLAWSSPSEGRRGGELEEGDRSV